MLLGYRWYFPGWGRFLTPDPSGRETNHHAYAHNDPINNTDPNGTSVLAGIGLPLPAVGNIEESLTRGQSVEWTSTVEVPPALPVGWDPLARTFQVHPAAAAWRESAPGRLWLTPPATLAPRRRQGRAFCSPACG